ncbi:MAG: DUF2169 domain-containing protein [Myxococcales bacterium]|nr:DUF2169 domain-containing protein [Myxococcales bacterium]
MLPPRPKRAVPVLADPPFVAATRPWQLRPPKDALIVIAKCTLTLVPGETATACDEQQPLTGDLPHDDDPAASLRYASDFAPFKPLCDVMMVGHAYPHGHASVALVQLVFGSLRRAIAAVGEREWSGGVPSSPRPFERMPLRFERSYGGAGIADNPLGLWATRPPNLEWSDHLARTRNDRGRPACFGPVSELWSPRSNGLGSYGHAWKSERWPYFPADFDWHHFNAALPELRIPYPRGDERFDLAGVRSERTTVSGRLPGLRPRAIALLAESQWRDVPMLLDTVWFDADLLKVSLVWRGAVEVSAEHAPEVERVLVFQEVAALPMTNADIDARIAALGGTPARAALAPSASLPQLPQLPELPELPRIAPAMADAEALAFIGAAGSLAGASLYGCKLDGADFRGKNLDGALLHGASLEGCKLDGASLRGAVLHGASLVGATLTGADLSGANLFGVRLDDAVLDGADLSLATLANCRGARASFVAATLTRVNLAGAVLANAKFDRAKIDSAELSGATLTAASFRAATLDDTSIYDAHADGANFAEAHMHRFRADGASLERASFERADATDASFVSAKLSHAAMSEIKLDGAVLSNAELAGATLNRCSAKSARFVQVSLVRALAKQGDFMEASFESADLSGADFSGANLYCAETWKAKLGAVNLTGAIVTGSKLAK